MGLSGINVDKWDVARLSRASPLIPLPKLVGSGVSWRDSGASAAPDAPDHGPGVGSGWTGDPARAGFLIHAVTRHRWDVVQGCGYARGGRAGVVRALAKYSLKTI